MRSISALFLINKKKRKGKELQSAIFPFCCVQFPLKKKHSDHATAAAAERNPI